MSSSLSLSEVHLKICDLFSYVSTKDTRLWCKGDSENNWTKVNNDSHTVKDADVFMVEVKFYGNQWPISDNNNVEHRRDWRQFEIGDKVDIQNGEKWKIGQVVKVFNSTLKIHLVNENWNNDLTIPRNSVLLERFGKHTLSLHFKPEEVKNLKGLVIGLQNIGNTCYMNAVL